ncbi:hypothetical protein GCM10023329_11530 [Streptomyces sanyensis]|uniref:Uncharacterized protein n=1 Tax=Streptomyces sanyensis TaxID=568869 RepID=A0ABP8ZVZ8_9ACTN
MQGAVAEPLGGLGEGVRLAGGEHTGREAHARQCPVVRRVQPQRAGAGITALPYGSFVPIQVVGGGWRHGGEHTDAAPGHLVPER